jgi:hypothetical protein
VRWRQSRSSEYEECVGELKTWFAPGQSAGRRLHAVVVDDPLNCVNLLRPHDLNDGIEQERFVTGCCLAEMQTIADRSRNEFFGVQTLRSL